MVRRRGRNTVAAIAVAVAIGICPLQARAEEVRVVGGFGLCYLPVYLALDKKLIEKHAAAAGLPNVKVSFQNLSNGPAITDALLSGSADIAMAGVSVMLNVSDKSGGSNPVKGMMAICDSPIYFDTIDPRIRSIKDFADTDRIAMAAGRGTQHSLVLEMGAAQAFGWDQRHKFDSLAVSMSHPDGVMALKSGGSVIKTHVTTVPFIQMEMKIPGVRTILSSYDVAGGRHTLISAYAAQKWRLANPKLFQATLDALTEAMQIINADKRAAAELFVRMEPSGLSVDEICGILQDENMMYFSPTPRKVMVWADYMAKTGLLKKPPPSWKDAFFDNIHGADGD
jgi:NitT/TauT family transport system substrate-binding protein